MFLEVVEFFPKPWGCVVTYAVVGTGARLSGNGRELEENDNGGFVL